MTSLSGNEATSLSSPPSAETNRRSVLMMICGCALADRTEAPRAAPPRRVV